VVTIRPRVMVDESGKRTVLNPGDPGY
jgi:hypothetical protein